MDTKSSSASQVISLPQGGGAIRGIGESFQANAFSGTGNFTIPIPTSPGRSGFDPKLSLQYSSGNGNGVFGLGWSLSVPRVSRKTEKGLPKYDSSDTFVISGAEDLVPHLATGTTIPQTVNRYGFSIQRYRPRTEGLFARIEQWVEDLTGTVHWRATTKENVTSIFGRTKQACVIDPADPNPDRPSRIFEWLLEETFDNRGNHTFYEYAMDDPELKISTIYEENRTYCQRYLRRIYYGNIPNSIANDEVNAIERQGSDSMDPCVKVKRRYAFEIVFDYHDYYQPAYDLSLPEIACGLHPEPPPNGSQELFGTESASISVPIREDAFSTYRAGFEIRTLRLCRRIMMFHHFKELTCPTLVKAINFDYSTNSQTNVSFLVAATVTGYNRKDEFYIQRSMPPVTFTYSEFTPFKQRYQSLQAVDNNLPPLSMNNPDIAFVDLFGDGLPDILHTGSTGFRYWKNLGGGLLDRPQFLRAAPAGVCLSLPGVGFADMGGDGRVELLTTNSPDAGFYETTPDGGWKNFKQYEKNPSFNLSDPNVRLIDLTGDGRSDVLLTSAIGLVWCKCLGEEGYDEPVRAQAPDELGDVSFNDPSGRLRLADMNGDGLSEIILLHQGRVDYWPNIGHGRFGSRITMGTLPDAPDLDYSFDPKRLFLVDLNGSGCSDLVYVDFDRIYFWFNRSGNGWSERQTIYGTPPAPDTASIRFEDIFGTGTAAIIWSYDYGTFPGANYKVLDFCGGVKPYLLTAMDNNMGASTCIQYAPSVRYAIEDRKSGCPWPTNLPFPVHVVEKVEVTDQIGRTKLTTTYAYHHGYYDGREREFRGFGCVDQCDTEEFDTFTESGLHGDMNFTNNEPSFHVPRVLTRSWFHTGIYFDEDIPQTSGSFFDYHDLMTAYRAEFYKGDPDAFTLAAHEVEESATPHETFRALRGALIRKEVYGLDGSNTMKNAGHPYLVSENRYKVQQLQPGQVDIKPVVMSVLKESITYQYERNRADPRITHQLTLANDEFGNITDSVSIGYPRRPTGNLFDTAQSSLQAIYTYNRFINKTDDPDIYYAGINYENRTFEVHGLRWNWVFGAKQLKNNDFASIVADPDTYESYEYVPPENLVTMKKRLVDWKRIYFRKNSDPSVVDLPNEQTHRLLLGEIASIGLPYESYQVAFTNNIKQTFQDGAKFQLKFDITPTLLTDEGGYHWEDNYWWIPSGKQGFDSTIFFQPIIMQDPFGSQSAITYDHYGLLAESTQGPLNSTLINTVSGENDYRTLKPWRVVDANGNSSEVRFDALGLVAGTAIKGKHNEGDSLNGFEEDLDQSEIETFFNDPFTRAAALLGTSTARCIYDLNSFKSHRDTLNPVYTATIRRETHHSDALDNTEVRLSISFSFSDGFGREIQKKIQAEPGKVPIRDPISGRIIIKDSYPVLSDTDVSPRWVGNGWTIFNNKGKPVKQYEPFFSDTHTFDFDVRIGVTPVLFYDPLIRPICTLHPNHTFSKVVFGPWQQVVWDVNDTVKVSPHNDPDIGGYVKKYIGAVETESGQTYSTWYDEKSASTDPAEQAVAVNTVLHAATPATTQFDVLGRPYVSIVDNGIDKNGNRVLLKTKTILDIENNPLEIIDPRNLTAFKHRFDIAGRKVFVKSVDAGYSIMFPDATGNPLRTQDNNGNITILKYDALHRLTQTWVIPGCNGISGNESEKILSNLTIYGEQLRQSDWLPGNNDPAIMANHCGRAYAVFDGAGAVFSDAYDFKGNLLQGTRRLSKQFQGDIDWKTVTNLDFSQSKSILENTLETILEKEIFCSSSSYDAFNRVVQSVVPDHSFFSTDSTVFRDDGTIIRPRFNEAGLLDSIQVDAKIERNGADTGAQFTNYVKNINYNAKGQREEILFGNEVKTTYCYELETYRLKNLVSRKNIGDGTALQILSYTYDPSGNITSIRDDAHKTIFNHNTIIKPESNYKYDPLYRLINATGREHEAMTAGHYQSEFTKQTEIILLKNQPITDGQALCNYSQEYEYDGSGNLTAIRHHNLTCGTNWNRVQEYDIASNRIKLSSCVESDISTINLLDSHDCNGNITKLPHLPALQWNFRNQLVKTQLNVASTPNYAYYQYDSAGQRVRKVVTKGNIREEWIYLGNYEIYRKYTGVNDLRFERQTLHVMDDKNCIALLETRTRDIDNIESELTNFRVRYQHSNHLGSSMLEVDNSVNAKLISYEEYYPYGETAYLAGDNEIEVKRKRYRYSGKERDDETGLYYYGARYYAAWMGRWISCDPAGMVDGVNLFTFVQMNPIRFIDSSGRQSSTANPGDTSTCLPPANNLECTMSLVKKDNNQLSAEYLNLLLQQKAPPAALNPESQLMASKPRDSRQLYGRRPEEIPSPKSPNTVVPELGLKLAANLIANAVGGKVADAAGLDNPEESKAPALKEGIKQVKGTAGDFVTSVREKAMSAIENTIDVARKGLVLAEKVGVELAVILRTLVRMTYLVVVAMDKIVRGFLEAQARKVSEFAQSEIRDLNAFAIGIVDDFQKYLPKPGFFEQTLKVDGTNLKLSASYLNFERSSEKVTWSMELNLSGGKIAVDMQPPKEPSPK